MNIFVLFVVSSTISGKVFNLDSKLPLQAHIYVKSLDHTSICDSLGEFIIHHLREGRQHIIVSHVGFKEETLNVHITETDTLHLNIGLKEIPISIKPVEVSSERIPDIYTQTIAQEEIHIIPGAEKDVFKALQTLPGVSTPSDYFGLFYVRGGDLYENKVLLDDMEILSPYHYLGLGSAFNTDLIEDLEFYLGTFPARYGDAISSVLNVHSKESNDMINGTLSVDLMEANWFYSCPISSTMSFIFSSKRNYLDLLLEKLGITEGVILPYYVDHQAKISINSALGDFSIGGLKSKEGTNITASFAEEILKLEIEGGGNSIAAGWSKQFTNSINCRANLFYSDMNRYLYGEVPMTPEHSEVAEEEVNAQKYGGIFRSEYDSDIINLEVGGGIGRYIFMHTGPKVEDILYKIGAINYSLNVDTVGNYRYVYASQRLALLRPIIWEIGERIDWFPLIEKPVFSPRIRFIYETRPTFYIAYGHQHQLPPLEYTLEELKSSYAKCLSCGIEYLIIPTLLGKIEVYRKDYGNLVRKYGEDDFKIDGDGYASGIEISLRKYRFGGTFGWLSYAYSSSKKVSPYDAVPLVTDVHRPHLLNVVLGKHFNNGFEIGIKYQLSTGLAYRPLIGKEYNWPSESWRAVYAPDKSRLPYYQRLDVHLEKEFSLLGFEGELYITVLNITNHRNVQGYLYNSSFTERKAFYMFPRVPFVGIRLKF